MKLTISVFGIFFLLASCGGSGGSSSEVFYGVASKVLPSIKAGTSGASSVKVNDATTDICASSPSLGTVARTVCDTFETYTQDNWNNEEATLGHRVSMTNFYKFMIQTDAYISDGLRQTCEAVDGKVKVKYDDNSTFWTSDDTYACKATYTETSNRFKAYAWDSTNNKYAVLYDHQDSNDEAMTFGSKTANAFDLTVKSSWSLPGEYRRFTGSVTEHSFTMQNVTGNNPTKLVLAGLAQGLDKHFLAKYVDGSNTEYYCFTIAEQETMTTSNGLIITRITKLDVSAPLLTCTSSDCGGCEADSITLNGVLRSLPDAADAIMTDLADTTGYQATQHFKAQFDAL